MTNLKKRYLNLGRIIIILLILYLLYIFLQIGISILSVYLSPVICSKTGYLCTISDRVNQTNFESLDLKQYSYDKSLISTDFFTYPLNFETLNIKDPNYNLNIVSLDKNNSNYFSKVSIPANNSMQAEYMNTLVGKGFNAMFAMGNFGRKADLVLIRNGEIKKIDKFENSGIPRMTYEDNFLYVAVVIDSINYSDKVSKVIKYDITTGQKVSESQIITKIITDIKVLNNIIYFVTDESNSSHIQKAASYKLENGNITKLEFSTSRIRFFIHDSKLFTVLSDEQKDTSSVYEMVDNKLVLKSSNFDDYLPKFELEFGTTDFGILDLKRNKLSFYDLENFKKLSEIKLDRVTNEFASNDNDGVLGLLFQNGDYFYILSSGIEKYTKRANGIDYFITDYVTYPTYHQFLAPETKIYR